MSVKKPLTVIIDAPRTGRTNRLLEMLNRQVIDDLHTHRNRTKCLFVSTIDPFARTKIEKFNVAKLLNVEIDMVIPASSLPANVTVGDNSLSNIHSTLKSLLAAARDDETFSVFIDDLPSRNLTGLTELFKELGERVEWTVVIE